VNPEYEEEKRKEKIKQEKFYNACLGGDEDQRKHVPWYAKEKVGDEKFENNCDKKKSKKKSRVDSEDPLVTMKALQSKKEKEKDPKQGHWEVKAVSVAFIILWNSLSVMDNSMESLRAKRLKREHEERIKANSLLGISTPSEATTRHTEDSKYFHSQFNPDFVRLK
ncbi:hypothetical protein HK096_008276, partial [Nowakowskiella sp. JEL0078]